MIKNYDKILVIQTAFIGDAILATALLEKLHAHYPDAQIDLLVAAGSAGLFEGHPYLGRLIVWNKKEKWASWRACLRLVRQTRYDLVVNLQRFGSMAMFTALSGAAETRGFNTSFISRFFSKRYPHVLDASGKTKSPHEISRNQSIIADITDGEASAPRLYPTVAHSEKAAAAVSAATENKISLADDFVCFAPSSVWATKQLPLAKWLELAKKLSADVPIFLLGGPADAELCEALQAQAKGRPNIYNLAGRLGLLETAALMQKAQMNYVNDSAPLHVASAMAAPVTAFFCSTVPNFGFTPIGDKAMVLEVGAGLACRPCGVHGHKKCPEGHFKCGDISLKS